MKEQFLNGFMLNNNYNNPFNNRVQQQQQQNTQNKKEEGEKLFDFNAKDRFTESFKKNEVMSMYTLLTNSEKNSEKARQLEKEIEQIKEFETKTRDYFNF